MRVENILLDEDQVTNTFIYSAKLTTNLLHRTAVLVGKEVTYIWNTWLDFRTWDVYKVIINNFV